MSILRAIFPILLAVTAMACAPEPSRGPVVLAAASMQDALGEAADEWTKSGHDAPVLSFAASSALARQIEAGAPADLFISADEAWMDMLESDGLLRDGSRTPLAGNALVLVRPGDAPAEAPPMPRARFAIADPDGVPAGRYARAALQALDLWDAIEPRMARADNVRGALALAERGEVDFAVVYASDAAASDAVTVERVFDPASHPKIVYPLAVLASSSHPDAADLRAFLLSNETRAILLRHGFSAP